MGAYLSEPITEKVSSDGCGKYITYGASSMQGWRVTQEDAHNCIVDFDENTSFFAVYDGHGGHEVAAYASEHYPDILKKSDKYKEGKLDLALKQTFLEFDAYLGSEEGLMNLELVSRDKNTENHDCNDSSDSETADNVHLLCQEAQLPIEEVIAKYHAENTLRITSEDKKCMPSPYLRAPRISNLGAGSTSSSGSMGSEGGCSSHQSEAGSSHSADTQERENEGKNCVDVKDRTTECEAPSSDIVCELKKKNRVVSESGVKDSDSNEVEAASIEQCDHEKPESVSASGTQNGDIKCSGVVSKSLSPHENGEASSLEKNRLNNIVKRKRITKVKETSESNSGNSSDESETPVSELSSTQLLKQVYRELLADPSDSDSDDDDDGDETFQTAENSSDDDDEDAEDKCPAKGDEDGEEEEDEESSIDDEEEDEDEISSSTMEVPGMDSGCTAVVALLRGRDLYVANAGDSRCVLCCEGKAIDMSVDHKPEDDEEMERIANAGGKVTPDGRVNGGLNLSRAFGDHAYKQNVHLSPEEQMITANPDIQKYVVNPAENDFMILACDGIWNYMSSQQVVDFVRARLPKTEKLSTICEELFDHCLAPNTLGDGTGCDNMTAVIVKFLPGDDDHSLSTSECSLKGEKRTLSTDGNTDTKRMKMD